MHLRSRQSGHIRGLRTREQEYLRTREGLARARRQRGRRQTRQASVEVIEQNAACQMTRFLAGLFSDSLEEALICSEWPQLRRSKGKRLSREAKERLAKAGALRCWKERLDTAISFRRDN